tara:strand:+ start:2029 stop:2358 length:330 start_codon:yes stop_codon:yes gene_type:complete
MSGEQVLYSAMINKFIFLFLIASGCVTIKQNKIINNDLKFNYKAQVNLYSNKDKKKIIKKFYKFSNLEHLARDNINQQCLDHIKINKLKNVRCIYMGTKLTEKMLTRLN